MRSFFSVLLPVLLFSPLLASAALAAAPAPADAGIYRNLFRDYLGKSDAEIAAKLDAAWQQLVAGDENSARLIYRVPGDMAYIPDVNNNDVRSEGLSYGMMIAVQLDRRAEFDALWRYAQHYMQHRSGPLRGYFAWHTAFDGRQLSAGPACDGEEWFVMSLFFAAHRWQGGARPPGAPENSPRAASTSASRPYDYAAAAQSLLRTMIHAHEEPDRAGVTSMFDPVAKQINFVPHAQGSTFTDPSYHLPAFYELWSRWAADPADRAFLAEVTRNSREQFRRAAHPQTGLMPDYSNFDGTPHRARWGNHDDFLYDAWRTLSNPAVDYAWWAADPWQVEHSNRVLKFLASAGTPMPVLYKLDGTPLPTQDDTVGLTAMAATTALAADRAVGEPWVKKLWDLPMPTGRFRYYSGLLTMLALLECSGNFRVYAPPAQ